MPDQDTHGPLLLEEELPADHRSGFVAVIGRPNVGKSTLLNRLLGQKIAITSPKPQTTREQLLGILTTADAQLIFLDTPGIHKPLHKLGHYMVTVAQESMADSDLLLWVVDLNTPPTAEDQLIGQLLQELATRRPLPPLVLGLNQVDRWQGDAAALAQRTAAYLALVGNLPGPAERAGHSVHSQLFSAQTGAQIEALLALVRGLLPLGPRYYPPDQVTDLQTRFIVAELVREQALRLLQQEVPHSIAVVVDEFQARSAQMTYISATIYVERPSQKGIVLGQGGSMIKRIGQAARPQIEELLETQVYLELWVKVWEKWRKREHLLNRLGYRLSRK